MKNSNKDFQTDKEILKIHVFITGARVKKEDETGKIVDVYFTGYCDNEYFKGSIQPGAVDEQFHSPGSPPRLRAEYTLEGIDSNKDKCRIHIINQSVNGEWKPNVITDSKELEFLNKADLTATIEGLDDRIIIRIFL